MWPSLVQVTGFSRAHRLGFGGGAGGAGLGASSLPSPAFFTAFPPSSFFPFPFASPSCAVSQRREGSLLIKFRPSLPLVAVPTPTKNYKLKGPLKTGGRSPSPRSGRGDARQAPTSRSARTPMAPGPGEEELGSTPKPRQVRSAAPSRQGTGCRSPRGARGREPWSGPEPWPALSPSLSARPAARSAGKFSQTQFSAKQ